VTESVLPPIEERLAHALSHDLQAPLRMLAPVLGLLADDDRGDRMLAAATGGLGRLDELLAALVSALRAPVDVAGVTASAEVDGIVAAAWASLSGPDDHLDVTTSDLPLPAGTAAAVIHDLLAHALAERGETPRRVRFGATGARLVATDDGPAPTPSPAGRVRAVAGATAVGLLVTQRLAVAAGGALSVDATPGAVTVTLDLPGDHA
jgi:hypothetical protein